MKRSFLALAFLAFTFVACQKEPLSPVDPLPFPMDANKDLSVAPGDDFWQYCNGSWFKAQGPVASGAIGGLYDAEPEMNRRVEELRTDVPSLKLFFDMKENMYATPEASQAFIDAGKATVKHPETYEEAFRAMGAMIMDGLYPFSTTFRPAYVDGRFVGALFPPMPFPTTAPDQLIPASSLNTKAGEALVFDCLAQGMGISMDLLYVNETLVSAFEILRLKTLDELYTMMQEAWESLEPFVSPEALEAYNAKTGQTITAETVQQQARILINYPLSYELAKKYIPESVKQHYKEIVEAIQVSLRKRILQVDWMSNTTKNNALNKLDKMRMYVAYPDQWYEEGLPDISGCKTFAEMAYVLGRSQQHVKAKLLGTQDSFSAGLLTSVMGSDLKLYPADLTLVNACYSPSENCILIYPALLLPPYMKEGVTEARVYAVFVSIGHEFTHGFDSSGARYDADGSLHNWWTVADQMSFEDKQQNLINCYNHLEYYPEAGQVQYGDGARTLGENIADLGGFLTVLDVYKERLQEQGYSGDSYKAQLRKFYESYADVWCIKYGPDRIQNFIKNDVHSPARLRVNGVVMNTDLWYELYDVTRDHKLYLPEERRTYIW